MSEPDKVEVPLLEVFRLHDKLNRSITYRGYNAQEIQALGRLSSADWHRARVRYADVLSWRLTRPALAWVLLFVGIACRFILPGDYLGYAMAVAIGSACYLAHFYGDRSGHREGYFDGFGEGFDQGINRALGISDEDARDLQERAIQMETDAIAIEALSKKTRGHVPAQKED